MVKVKPPFPNGDKTRAAQFEICRKLEMCRKDVVSINCRTPFWMSPDSVLDAIHEAVVEYLSIIGRDDQMTIYAMMKRIVDSVNDSNATGVSDKAVPLSVLQDLEICRREIKLYGSPDRYMSSFESIVSSVEEAIIEFAIILGYDKPGVIHSVLDEIGYDGIRSFDYFEPEDFLFSEDDEMI